MVANLRYKYLLYLILVLILGCKDNNDDKNELVFRYNEHASITSLDPIFAKDQRNIWACNQIFSGLVQLDDQLNIKPDVASNWEISEDATSYTFHLRNDVFFHQHPIFGKQKTRAVTASDFVYSLNRLIDPKNASPGSTILKMVDQINAINDQTLKITLKTPFPAFLGLLSMKYCSVVPKEVIELYGSEFGRNPIGTGPFYFKKWLENTKLVFRKNKAYYEKDEKGNTLPYLEAVAISFLPDKQSEFLQFAQGNIDFISGLAPSYKDELLTFTGKLKKEYQDQVNMISGPYLNTEYLGFYMENPSNEIASPFIRKAINYGFDRQKMITYLRNGIGTPATSGFIPNGLPSFNNQKGYDYNPKKAKEYLDSYIKESGNKTPKIVIATNSSYLDLCEYIQRELEKIGLQVTIDLLTPSTLRKKKAQGELPCFRASWIADYPDAENYLSLFYSPNFTPNGSNYTHFKDVQYDTLYEQAMTTTSTAKRHQLYQKMDSIIIQKAPIVPLYYDKALRFTRKNIKGLGINPINLLTLKTVRKSTH